MNMNKSVCHISMAFPNMTGTKKTETRDSVYNAPNGWIITGYKPVIKTGLGPCTWNVDMVAANSNFASSSELNEAYQEALNIQGSLTLKGQALADLKAQIDNSYSQFRSYQSQISASHQTLTLTGTIRGQGAFNGRTILEMYLNAELKEVPSFMGSGDSISSTFKKIIADFVANNDDDTGATSGESTDVIGNKVIVQGHTSPQQWVIYDGGRGIYVDVDTSMHNFRTTPHYLTTLEGTTSHWATQGVTSIYNASPNSFRVYVGFINRRMEQKYKDNWYLKWTAIGDV